MLLDIYRPQNGRQPIAVALGFNICAQLDQQLHRGTMAETARVRPNLAGARVRSAEMERRATNHRASVHVRAGFNCIFLKRYVLVA